MYSVKLMRNWNGGLYNARGDGVFHHVLCTHCDSTTDIHVCWHLLTEKSAACLWNVQGSHIQLQNGFIMYGRFDLSVEQRNSMYTVQHVCDERLLHLFLRFFFFF